MRFLAITPPASPIDVAVVDAWLDAGARELGLAVLLREPNATIQATLASPRLFALREVLAARDIPMLASLDAGACDAGSIAALLDTRPALAGVQLRGDPSPELCMRWRDLLGDAIIGRSCHGVTPGPRCDAVDYTCLAPIFAPRTAQPGVNKQAIGLDALRRWTAEIPRVLALGGVEPSTAEACLAAGAAGVAGISLFFGQSADAHQNVAALRQVFARFEADGRLDDHAPPAQRR